MLDKGSKRPTMRSRELRSNMTTPERKLWSHLRARRVASTRFNTQFPIGPDYIADFAARSARLVIEVDGDTHAFSAERDAARTAYLMTQGYRVIRFWNNEVMSNIDGVVQEIERVLADTPSPNPSRKREGDKTCPLATREVAGEPLSSVSDERE